MQCKVTKQRIQYNGEWFEKGAPIELSDSEAATLIQAELVEEVKKPSAQQKEKEK